MDDRDRAIGDELPGETLDGDRDDLLRLTLGLLARLLLDLADAFRRLVLRLVHHLIDGGTLRLLAREAGDALERRARLADEAVALRRAVGEMPLAAAERVLLALRLAVACLEPLELAVEAFL